MQRTIVGYDLDEEDHWIALLDCAHGQHVRHRPPFTERAWTQTSQGRDDMLGTQLDCLKCERLELPQSVEVYSSTPEFNENTLPASLTRNHTTKRGVWGQLKVLEGTLDYVVTSPFQHSARVVAGDGAHIAPEVLHFITPLTPTVRLIVEFLRVPKA